MCVCVFDFKWEREFWRDYSISLCIYKLMIVSVGTETAFGTRTRSSRV